MAADFPLRQRLAQLGARFFVDSGLLEWSPRGARLISFLDESEQWLEADSLVLATANSAEDSLYRELLERDQIVINIGDSVASRQAPYAIYEGRKVGLNL